MPRQAAAWKAKMADLAMGLSLALNWRRDSGAAADAVVEPGAEPAAGWRASVMVRLAAVLAAAALVAGAALGSALVWAPAVADSPWLALGVALLWAALLAGFCLAAAWRLVAQPLARLAQMAERAAEGGDSLFDALEPGLREGELGRLARRIDGLTRQRQNHRRECQRCVADFERANRQVAAANQSRAQFVATVSHELRTPLNAIIGFSQLMRDEMTGNPRMTTYADFSAEIYASGNHLLEVINEMLELANLEGGRRRVSLAVISVREVFDVCLRAVAGRAASAGLRLTVEASPEAASLTADFNLTKQMLGHLLDNAVKFTPTGGTIALQARRDGGRVVMSVCDSGIGMTADDVTRAFQPFWQAAPVMTRDYGGTGLGLTLVKAMVELHEGEVKIDSAPGRGTVVSIALPLRETTNDGTVVSRAAAV